MPFVNVFVPTNTQNQILFHMPLEKYTPYVSTLIHTGNKEMHSTGIYKHARAFCSLQGVTKHS